MKVEERQKFLLVLTIAVVALYAGNLLIFTPMGRLWKSRSDTIKELRNDVKEGKFLLVRESAIRSNWEKMSTNMLPSNTSLAEQQMFTSFDNWSLDSGATVTGITPEWKNDSTNYMTLNCRVEASGDLKTLSSFVYDIEKGPMALKLDSIELSARDTIGQQLTLGLQLSGLALTTLQK
jgi:Tfp pilus assembly protein PilO